MANAFYILQTKLPKEVVLKLLVNIAEEMQWVFMEEDENKLMFKKYDDIFKLTKTTIEFHLLGQNLNVFINDEGEIYSINKKKIASFLIKYQQMELEFFGAE